MGSSPRSPLARIAFIDRAIRAGGWPNANTLARDLEVSARTVQRDIIFLRDRLQAPVEFDSHRHGYHLIAYCHFRKEIRTFAVVRIRSVRETGETFTRPPEFQIESFFGASFRALCGRGHHQIVLRFPPYAASRAGEKIWHRTQTTELQPDGSLLLRMELSDLREVKRWILSWGSECEVLEPEELRAMVREEVETLRQVYAYENR